MYLKWIPAEAKNVQELLWYLHESPPESPKSARPPPEVTIVERAVPSLFALIIGISQYRDTALNLRGCAPDADLFEDLLKSVYRVPSERIKNLRNEEATRQGMLQAIKDLADSPKISASDPIVIFYAGHGGEFDIKELSATKGLSDTEKMIQFLLPYDFVSNGSSTKEGQGIFDITLSRLLTEIAEKKSDNITVILDSCHSGSGTRKDKRDETFAVRGVELPSNYTIPASIIEEEELDSGERGGTVATGAEKKGLRSHVLLAACQHGQTAKERKGNGDFTSRLVPLLREDGLDRVTYRDVINRLPPLPEDQNPQCEGINAGRIIFDGKVSTPRRALYNVRRGNMKTTNSPVENYDFVVGAGEAHGVMKGAEFAVYSDQKMKHLVGRVRAVRIDVFIAGCLSLDGSELQIPQPAYAILTRLGEQQDLRLYVEPRDEFLPLFVRITKEMEQPSEDRSKRSFRLLNSPEEGCDLALTLKDDGCIQFNITDPTCLRYGLRTMPVNDISTDDPDHLINILRSAADFYWNLHHSKKEGTSVKGEAGRPSIELECLKVVDDPRKYNTYKPEQGEENLNVQGTIYVDVSEGAMYGFRIKNKSDTPLYAALLYFDINDCSVESYYMPPDARDGVTDPSLPVGGSLEIGWGDSGTVPYRYGLRKGQTIDVGFLKLYVSAEYIDFSQVVQRSQFTPERQGFRVEAKPRPLWDSMLVNIIQRDSNVTQGFDAGTSASVGGGVNDKPEFASFGLGFGF
ncbi:hypothetical protein AAF712_006490 [Marasmius tenuissimus]|uniref:Peptidase C14 caspase domain-containing protein n=1 Tax=Marasmius tenuissimus TaxID=585030 RepID=A0ABR2ZYK8_9AGAR